MCINKTCTELKVRNNEREKKNNKIPNEIKRVDRKQKTNNTQNEAWREKKIICTGGNRKTVEKRSISTSFRVHDTFIKKKKDGKKKKNRTEQRAQNQKTKQKQKGNMFIIHHREFAPPSKIFFISFPFYAKERMAKQQALGHSHLNTLVTCM